MRDVFKGLFCIMNDRQKNFVQQYVMDFNATAAAVRAGYSKKIGYSQGSRLLKKAEVQQAIQQKVAERKKNIKVTVESIVEGLAEIALHGQSESARVRAYELLGKHLNMWTDKVDMTSGGEPIITLFHLPDNGKNP